MTFYDLHIFRMVVNPGKQKLFDIELGKTFGLS